MEKIKLEQLWVEIQDEVSIKKETGIWKRLIFPKAEINMFVGIKTPTVTRLFLLQVPGEHIPPERSLPQSQGFITRLEKHGDEPDGFVTFTISISSNDYNDLFSALVFDIVGHVYGKKDYKQVINALLERLGMWQRFFVRIGFNGLSDQAQRGLYGELWLLREYLLKYLSVQLAIISWTGPKGANQDFQLPYCWVEVKTTIAKQHQKLTIANERQLDDSNTDALFVFHLSLEASFTQGESLVKMVASIRSLLRGLPQSLSFENLLIGAGYVDVHESHYIDTGYSKREANMYEVRDGFPRIIEKNIPVGVGDVSYSVAIAECKRFSVKDSAFISSIQRC